MVFSGSILLNTGKNVIRSFSLYPKLHSTHPPATTVKGSSNTLSISEDQTRDIFSVLLDSQRDATSKNPKSSSTGNSNCGLNWNDPSSSFSSSMSKLLAKFQPTLESYDPRQFAQSHFIVHVKASPNNTLLTLTDSNGNVLLWSSGGLAKFKKAQRSGYEAATQATQLLIDRFQEKYPKLEPTFTFKIKGFGPGREAAFRTIKAANWNIQTFLDCTPIPHGGCRPPKAKRR